MRIAYLTSQYPKVSHTFIRREIHELEARGHEVARFSVRRTDDSLHVDASDRDERERTRFILATGPLGLVRATLLALARAPVAWMAALGMAMGLGAREGRGLIRHLAYFVEACFFCEAIRGRDIEHLHVHFGTNPTSVALLANRLQDIPFSFTVHGPDEFDAPVQHALARKVAAASFVVAISHFTSAQLRRWVAPADWPKIHVVRCAVDDRYLDEAPPIPQDSKTLVCVGRLCPQKGQMLLVEAFARCLEKHPDSRLVLAGDGEMRPELEALISGLGIQEQVRITGWLDEAGVRGELRGARAMVLASFAEGLPVVIMEALAMGRPVVSTYIAGIPELVRRDECGWLVPSGDPAALCEALEDALAATPQRLEELGRNGAAAVRERHSLSREVDRLEALMAGRG
jgi:colanic acid/amylovoran biosynthesis glycosyltransferase